MAFKVDTQGRATPKGPDDLKVPQKYNKDVNPQQNKAYTDEAMKLGHPEAKPSPPTPPPPEPTSTPPSPITPIRDEDKKPLDPKPAAADPTKTP